MGTKDTRIGDRIKAYRSKKGMTQKALADLLEMSQQQLGAYENGVRVPRPDTLRAMADKMGIPIDELDGPSPAQLSDYYSAFVIDMIESQLPKGYTLHGEQENGFLWLQYPDGTQSRDLSLEEIREIILRSMDYMRFELEKLRRRPDDEKQ